jgi:hypothetical protein
MLRVIFRVTLFLVLLVAVSYVFWTTDQVLVQIAASAILIGGLFLAASENEWMALTLGVAAYVMAAVAVFMAAGGLGNVGLWIVGLFWLGFSIWLYLQLLGRSPWLRAKEILLINRYSGSKIYGPKQLLFPPQWPGEEIAAVLSTEVLDSRFLVENISTPSEKKLVFIKFRLIYKIDVDDETEEGESRAFELYKNVRQDSVLRDEFRERHKSQWPLSRNPAYWQRMVHADLSKYIDDLCREVVRQVVYEPKDMSTPRPGQAPPPANENGAAVQLKGEKLHREIEDRMLQKVRSAATVLGLKIVEHLSLIDYEINPDHLKDVDAMERGKARREREIEAERVKAIGMARAEAQAAEITAMVNALHNSDSGRHLSPEQLRDIVRLAMEEVRERRLAEIAGRADKPQDIQ